MIQRFDGFDPKPAQGKREQLPVGGYVGKIIGVKTEYVGTYLKLILAIDVSEGDYKGFYARDLEIQKANGNGSYAPKHKGTYYIDVPENSSPDWVKRRFNISIGCIEASNPGYKFDWNEMTLKGKTVGFLTQEYEYNGNSFTRIGMLFSADRIRSGEFTCMSKRERKEETAPAPTAQTGGMMNAENDDDLPF